MNRLVRFFLVVGLGLGLAMPALADDAPPPAHEGLPPDVAKSIDAHTARAPIEERSVSVQASVSVRRAVLHYTTTAGTLTLRDAEGKPEASMFYVAYSLAGRNRPVTFFYNGGPGSASFWLDMGSLGPRRVATDMPGPVHNPPFSFDTNDDSLIDQSDLVFLDAIGTGYSRPLGSVKQDKFNGVDGDAEAFTHGIERYLTLNRRWNSPKFLFGESYGTTRSPIVAAKLQEDGVQLNGIILLSSILNYGIEAPGFDQVFIGYVPSYAAAAWYHHKLANRPAELSPYLDEVRSWAAGPYATALQKGEDLSPEETDAIARQLSAYIGVSAKFIEENHLRVPPSRFRKELLRDEHRTIGRYDARTVGIDTDDAGSTPEFDPSTAWIEGAFVAEYRDFLESTVGYHTDLAYRATLPLVGKWDWHHTPPGGDRQELPDSLIDLSATMRQNPHLRVLSLNGWYDLATPFFTTEYDLKHLELDPSLRGNVTFAYYPSGHMVYLSPAALTQMRADLRRFYDEAAQQEAGPDRAGQTTP